MRKRYHTEEMSMNVDNRSLFIADNLDVMRGINSECIDLIYLDPPFKSGKKWKAPIGSPAEGAEFKDIWEDEDIKHEWHGQIAEEHEELYQIIQASERIYDKSMKIYLMAMTVRLFEMHRILKPTGSIYLHCDPTASHYLKMVMDDVFGKDNFRNEIIWGYADRGRAPTGQYPRKHDTILFYTRTPKNLFNRQYLALSDHEIEEKYPHTDENGRFYWHSKKQNRKAYYNGQGKNVLSHWTDISIINQIAKERTGYPTQKPIALLKRIIEASTNEGDIVLDPFCGCATACVAAEQLHRQWVGIDISPSAENITKLRLDAETMPIQLRDPNPSQRVTVRTEPPKRTDDMRDTIQIRLPDAEAHKHALYGQQEGRCNGCQVLFPFRNMTIDHIVSQRYGGTDRIENLQLLCNACNTAKGTGTQEELIERLRENGIIQAA
ncbi:hypothetical protein C6496_13825 [Candidatus Poribacteria bacterium]|nr:MAG: hypothetical protein C6496_13825 [Candidatus Poribacteria bacterium]